MCLMQFPMVTDCLKAFLPWLTLLVSGQACHSADIHSLNTLQQPSHTSHGCHFGCEGKYSLI